ncbi:MAG: ornithine cyclodeaminase family protein [Deltaproteobacteria bacterium]|nr:ornithine cyclodeaminase family protein [Deltaproteobacteria bacterium]
MHVVRIFSGTIGAVLHDRIVNPKTATVKSKAVGVYTVRRTRQGKFILPPARPWAIDRIEGNGPMTLIISEPQTRKLIDMPAAVKLVEQIFRARAAGKTRNVPRRRLKGSQKQLNMMAAWSAESDLICLRSYAAGANIITLFDGGKGGAKGGIAAIVNMGFLSSLRTGAASGVAAKYLAPASSKVLGVIGPGWQATFQVEAIAETCDIEQVVVWGRTPKRRNDFIKQMSKIVKADWKEVDTIDEVESVSDILVVSTDSSTPVATGNSLKNNVLVASIGANSTVKHEVSQNLIRRMDYIVVDDVAAAKADSGDLVEACQTSIGRWEDIVPLEKVIAEGVPQPRPKRIFFQSNGIADEDLAVGKYVVDQAKRKKIKLKIVTEI